MEDIETDRLGAGEGALYIFERSESGYSVPYDADIHYDKEKKAPIVSLIRRNAAYPELRFIDTGPPLPRAPDTPIPGGVREQDTY